MAEHRTQPRSRMFQVGGRSMKTWNVHVGCDFLCTYCSARRTALTRLRNSPRYKDGFNPHMVRSEYGRRFKPGDFVFVGYMGTKSPLHYFHWDLLWPENLYLGATMETNRDYHLTRAPAPLYRYIAMRALTHPKKFLSIEPICDFDLDEMLSWIKEIAPQIIEVGADNYHNSLTEPPWEKVEQLLEGLENICPTVVRKVGLERLEHEPTGT